MDFTKNRLKVEDRAIHGWYRFVLAYPPHLVREYLDKFGADPERDWVFDPFSGTATTPLEARLNSFPVIASDANPVAVLANRVKLTWTLDLDEVRTKAEEILQRAAEHLRVVHMLPLLQDNGHRSLFGDRVEDLFARQASRYSESDFDPQNFIGDDVKKILPSGFISDRPLRRVLAIRYAISETVPMGDINRFMNLALANTIVAAAGNVAFGPEIYATKQKDDADVLREFYETVLRMIADLGDLITDVYQPYPQVMISQDDARTLSTLDQIASIGIVITSPPYPNEKDYTRTTRLENVLLGYLNSKHDLRALKQHLLRSNTRNVFASDDDDKYVRDVASVVRIADAIEAKRIALGKTSGFERLYHRVTRLYFGGMYRHLVQLRPKLRPGGWCAYVVGDQQSFFRVHIPTAQLLADVALKAGYKVEGIETWRNRFSTATKQQLEENVLILRKPE